MDPEHLKRKLIALLSADVKGYTRLMSLDEEATVRTLDSYKEAMGDLIRRNDGRVVDSIGDNLLAEFPSVVDAVQCAVEIQNEIGRRNKDAPEERRMEFRIGVNLGDVVVEGEKIFGDGVNIVARMEKLAEPRGVCISGTAYEQVRNRLPYGFKDLGKQQIKGIAEPVQVYRVLMEPKRKVAPKRGRGKGRKFYVRVGAGILMLVGVAALWKFALFPTPAPTEVASVERMKYPLPDGPSIAVLPFVNMSGDPKQEFLCDAMTEDIITALSRVPRLFVIARNSSFFYKGKSVKVKQVSEELGVRYVLEGSLQRSADRVRINVQLIDALTGHHLWAKRYERDLEDIFAMQDEITIKILSTLEILLTGQGGISEVEKFADKYYRGKHGLDCYLKIAEAWGYFQRYNIEGMNLSRRIAEEVIAMCPENPLGYLRLGWVYYWDYMLGNTQSPQETLEKSIQMARKVLAMNNFMSSAHGLLAQIYLIKREFDKAVGAGERAFVINPSSQPVLTNYSATLRATGRPEEAIPLLQKAIRQNPFGPASIYNAFGDVLRDAGRFEESVLAYKKAIQIAPDHFNAHVGLVVTYIWMGRENEARATAAEVLRINPKYSVDYAANTFFYKDQSFNNKIVGALRKAGLK
jgi:adenylate cyclase